MNLSCKMIQFQLEKKKRFLKNFQIMKKFRQLVLKARRRRFSTKIIKIKCYLYLQQNSKNDVTNDLNPFVYGNKKAHFHVTENIEGFEIKFKKS